MATRLYLPATASSTPITPTPDSAWESTIGFERLLTSTAKIADGLTTINYSDADANNQDCLFRQFISKPLTVGQTITGNQSLKAQLRCAERTSDGNMFLTVGIRVIAGDGTTVQKTILAVTRDDTEAEVRRLLDYCGLPFEPACLRFFENSCRVRTASSEQVRKPIFTEGLDYWRHYEPWLDPMKATLGAVLEAYPGVP